MLLLVTQGLLTLTDITCVRGGHISHLFSGWHVNKSKTDLKSVYIHVM